MANRDSVPGSGRSVAIWLLRKEVLLGRLRTGPPAAKGRSDYERLTRTLYDAVLDAKYGLASRTLRRIAREAYGRRAITRFLLRKLAPALRGRDAADLCAELMALMDQEWN